MEEKEFLDEVDLREDEEELTRWNNELTVKKPTGMVLALFRPKETGGLETCLVNTEAERFWSVPKGAMKESGGEPHTNEGGLAVHGMEEPAAGTERETKGETGIGGDRIWMARAFTMEWQLGKDREGMAMV